MRIILILILSFALVISFHCKKAGQPVATYEMTFKKDGAYETLTPYLCQARPNPTIPGKTDFMIVAKSKDNKIHFGISVQVNGNFTTGVYKTTDANCYVIADYFKNPGEPDEKDFAIDNAPGQPDGYFVITISYISDKEIKGTFSCNYLYERTYNEKIILTEGSFAAKRH